MTHRHIAACLAALAIGWAGASQAQAPSAAQLKQEGFAKVDAYAERMGRIGDAIFSYSEIGFQEFKTIALVKKELEANGFKVTTGVAGMPTAYMATYGTGGPKIGLMSEFDGIPGASQKPGAIVHDPIVQGAPGHGEGHNTNQPTLIGGAIAMKAIKDKYKLPGTIIVYGGPAEELLASRGYMAKAGLFDGVDAVIQVHVSDEFVTGYGLNNFANVSVQWSFKGRQAHGARPWQGTSALDAVELMDTGVNLMREHGYDPADARIHAVIPEGGKQPNVVPAEATIWYYIRAKTPELVQKLLDWNRDIAKGAAMATHTEVTERILSGSWPVNGNKALAEIVDSNIQLVGMPKWSADDVAFAKAMQKSMGHEAVGLATEVSPINPARGETGGGSTSDAGDLTWLVPSVKMYIPSNVAGALAGHHWSSAIGPATPVAHKGMAVGAKALVGAMVDLYTNPALVEGMHADFAKQLAAYPKWKSFIPEGAAPPIYLNAEEMALYRAKLAPYEYNPDSKQTYLEFLGVPYPPKAPETAIGKASNIPHQTGVKSSIDWQWK